MELRRSDCLSEGRARRISVRETVVLRRRKSILEMKIFHYDQLLQKMFQFIEDHLQLAAEEKKWLLDLTRPSKN